MLVAVYLNSFFLIVLNVYIYIFRAYILNILSLYTHTHTHTHTHIYLEEDMAAHSSIVAWRIPWAKKPGGLQSIGPQKVRHN